MDSTTQSLPTVRLVCASDPRHTLVLLDLPSAGLQAVLQATGGLSEEVIPVHDQFISNPIRLPETCFLCVYLAPAAAVLLVTCRRDGHFQSIRSWPP